MPVFFSILFFLIVLNLVLLLVSIQGTKQN